MSMLIKNMFGNSAHFFKREELDAALEDKWFSDTFLNGSCYQIPGNGGNEFVVTGNIYGMECAVRVIFARIDDQRFLTLRCVYVNVEKTPLKGMSTDDINGMETINMHGGCTWAGAAPWARPANNRKDSPPKPDWFIGCDFNHNLGKLFGEENDTTILSMAKELRDVIVPSVIETIMHKDMDVKTENEDADHKEENTGIIFMGNR